MLALEDDEKDEDEEVGRVVLVSFVFIDKFIGILLLLFILLFILLFEEMTGGVVVVIVTVEDELVLDNGGCSFKAAANC